MTKGTSSPSAKGTPKTAAKRGSNGTPPTDHSSEPISPASTPSKTWYCEREDGAMIAIKVPGPSGRISFSAGRGGGGEVRIYRNSTTKVYDAVLTGIRSVRSDQVEALEVPLSVPPTVTPKGYYAKKAKASLFSSPAGLPSPAEAEEEDPTDPKSIF